MYCSLVVRLMAIYSRVIMHLRAYCFYWTINNIWSIAALEACILFLFSVSFILATVFCFEHHSCNFNLPSPNYHSITKNVYRLLSLTNYAMFLCMLLTFHPKKVGFLCASKFYKHRSISQTIYLSDHSMPCLLCIVWSIHMCLVHLMLPKKKWC